MKRILILLLLVVVVAAIWFFVKGDYAASPEGIGTTPDEAKAAGYTAADFPGSESDYLKDMDKGLNAEQVQARLADVGINMSADEAWRRYNRGRINWAVWTGGNDRFWDHLTKESFGALDLLKTVSSHPNITYTENGVKYPIGRHNRWKWFGLINEPCFSAPTGGDPNRHGLYLDTRDSDCPPDPFADATAYPGVAFGARGKNIPVGSYYGEPSGVFGLRLFPNPEFDQAAQDHWNAEKYYTDPDYYNDPHLIRPYRVGMTCGFCHVGPDPTNPPDDPENPAFSELNNNPGAQYFWIDRIFFWNQDKSSYAWQLFHTSEPGALDTSFVSTDYINNPRTMNAVYSVAARLGPAARWGEEQLAAGGSDNNKQFNDYNPEFEALNGFYDPDTSKVKAAHVLKDGADSVGILGALNRVYLNIGLFSEEWLLHFKALTGGQEETPIEIAVARENSAMWNANETQTQDTALFFIASAEPDYLRDAPNGSDYIDDSQLERGAEVFADRCARCHSSKIPDAPADVDENNWDEYWSWSKTPAFKEAMTEIVKDPDFLKGNFLSTEKRIPVTLLGTNACSPLAANGLEGNIWDNFSSQSYKELPSVGTYAVQHPYQGQPDIEIDMPGYPDEKGGRGYTRPPSLISVWSTAPLGLSNAVGQFDYNVDVASRVASFTDSIRKWLLVDPRVSDVDRVISLGLPESIANPDLDGYMYRTTEKSWLTVPVGYLPGLLIKTGLFDEHIEETARYGEVLRIGPIPAGAPVGLISNLRILSEDRSLAARAAHAKELAGAIVSIVKALKSLDQNASDAEARAAFAPVVPKLLELSACPDFVVNKGHYFGTHKLPDSEGEPGLSEEDKLALIEFVKTF